MTIKEDHNRFRDIVRGRIKEDLKKYVSQREMIGKRENEFVKIPIPQIDIPNFRYGPKQRGGVGQGEGNRGDSLGDDSAQPGQGQAGNQPGDHLLEVEFSIDELAEILGEKLSLPRIKPKGMKQVEAIKRRYSGLSPVGPQGLKHFRSSYRKALQRSIATGIYDEENPIVIPIREDFRYRTVKETKKPMTNAVVIYMMDVSGSMGDEQKEIVRTESFWINAWLKRHYKGLETRFIVHDAVAKEVDEEVFFRTTESGGTLISSAYKFCQSLIEADYPPHEWNIYPFHFSDGDNWSGEDTRLCIKLIKDFFIPNCNVFCYGQVDSRYGSGQFLKDLNREFGAEEQVILSQIEGKDKILDSIREFLGKGK